MLLFIILGEVTELQPRVSFMSKMMNFRLIPIIYS